MEITLKAARVNRGYTQKRAAQLLGISVEALRSYEQGRSFPNIATVQKIEQVYQVTYDEIRFLVGERHEH